MFRKNNLNKLLGVAKVKTAMRINLINLISLSRTLFVTVNEVNFWKLQKSIAAKTWFLGV